MITFTDVARRAALQHGLVARAWLLVAGASTSRVHRWVVAGRLQVAHRGVYRVAGAPETWEQRLLAAVLAAGPGAVASHRSAATLWAIHDGQELEPRMARLLRSHGLPPAAYQHVVRHKGTFVAKVDFAYPVLRLAIEVDGRTSHSSPRAFQSDLERQNALVNLGWTVIRFTWHDVVRRPGYVAATVRAAIAAAELCA